MGTKTTHTIKRVCIKRKEAKCSDRMAAEFGGKQIWKDCEMEVQYGL